MKGTLPPIGPGFCLLLALVLLGRQPAVADCRSFSDLIGNGAFGVADREGQTLSSCNGDRSYVPASIIKISTALAALRLLGPDYRFTTEFFIDRERNLYIRGTGDPFLVSEEVERMVIALRARGLDRINNIFIDQGGYALAGQVPGLGVSGNPYDAPVAATAVNFNTVNIAVDHEGRVGSAEPQTPDLPIMEDMGTGLPPGVHRLNICRGGCAAEERSARYAAELFLAKWLEQGMICAGQYGVRNVPDQAQPVYTHHNSRNLEEVAASFLRFSNNYAANQVFLACGAVKYGYPATWAKAGKAVAGALADTIGPQAAAQLEIEEGAGLSRRSRVTVAAMLDILHAFRPYAHLLNENNRPGIKSGTLNGVYNLAGYTRTGNAFVILLNQQENSRDRVLQRLEKRW
ncbi:MAG TPA: peptidase S13 [Desulfobacteraceae bacterium]|nr:peptidase S13 [Desulfobacteraceae bacterium]